MDDKWIDYKTAAELMHRPAVYLRQRDASGVGYLHFPNIQRWQPGGKGTRLFVKREDVEAWIAASHTPVSKPIYFNNTGYQSILPELQQLGADRVIRSLGLKRLP